MGEKKEQLTKHRRIVIRGCKMVGKTAVTMQYTEGKFSPAYIPTISSSTTKKVNYNNCNYVLQIVDEAGQDEYSITNDELYAVDAYVLVYTIDNRNSFASIKTFNDKILSCEGPRNVPRILIANKCDLDRDRKVSKEEGESLAKELKCLDFYEVSAKKNENVSTIFVRLMQTWEGKQSKEGQSCNIM